MLTLSMKNKEDEKDLKIFLSNNFQFICVFLQNIQRFFLTTTTTRY